MKLWPPDSKAYSLESGTLNYAAAEVRSKIATHSVIVGNVEHRQQLSKTLKCWTCLLLVATTIRCDSQNFYQERMEVSRRNWKPGGSLRCFQKRLRQMSQSH